MGRSVTCVCGQRNRLDSYKFGELRQCVACGRPLPAAEPGSQVRQYTAEAFEQVVTGFEDDSAASGGEHRTGFESPEPDDSPPQPLAAPASAQRSWQGGIRETVRDSDEGMRCASCGRSFRGAWDRNERPGGEVCHICATQADQNYTPPSPDLRRELYRPVPPKKLAPKNPRDDSEAREKMRKKKQEVILLATIAVVTLILVNVLPVEIWAAMFFAADVSQAEGLSTTWHWVLRVANFVSGAGGHMVTLYVALSLSRLLHPGGFKQNIGPILFLGVAFEILNSLLILMKYVAGFFGPLGIVLIGIAFVVMMTTKFLLVSDRFHVGFESFVGLILAWVVASLFVAPGLFALEKLIQGVVAGIAL